MADLMSIARSGVLAAQKQMGVTSNNIANVGTEGYNRQVAEQRTSESTHIAGHFLGTGTYVSDVKRIYNDYAQRELSLSISQHSQAETRFGKMSELDQLFSIVGKAVPNSLNTLFENVNNLVDMPSDLGVRENLLTSAGQLTAAFNSLGQELEGQVRQVNQQLDGVVDRVNAITAELADINLQLQKVNGQDLQLLDQQDRLINELAEYVQVNVIPQDMGVKSVMAGGSIMLVAGETPMQLGLTSGDPITHETRLTGTSGDQTVVLGTSAVGGEMQALMDYRNQDLAGAIQKLGVMALGVADAFNQSQAAGFDLDGNVGQNLFSDINSPNMTIGRVAVYAGNTGTQALGVEIDDTSALTGGRYDLSFDGTDYQITDQYGTTTTLSADPNDATRLIGPDGFSLRVGAGTPAAGDKWTLTPSAGAAASIEVVMDNPRGLAAAGYGLETVTGNGEATLLAVDRTNPNLPGNGEVMTIDVDYSTTPSPTYSISDSQGNALATGAFTGNQIDALGFSLALDPDTATGDQFSLDISFGPGDNRNAVNMAGLATAKIMGGGNATMTDVYEGITTSVGGQTRAAEVALDSAETVKMQATERVAAESGVNLDEEAANLMRFQQAYQASARIMTVAKETFDTLFAAVR
ncbi:flagellar hook-associated protein FlgK [Ferrimonas balearica]|uniref:flagellar hook-associated protein FlgK n=1 Tax=Ferrimonas balearica TaxID=44012 RepID=UPI001C96A657|nr:flagellar hook-associated protein FlgK [Ferrimonas balearica]MBY6224709.1 flagellar hook-associated protein FlgK [Ferrimonas balearica]